MGIRQESMMTFPVSLLDFLGHDLAWRIERTPDSAERRDRGTLPHE